MLSPALSDGEMFFREEINEEKIQDQFQWDAKQEQAHQHYQQQQRDNEQQQPQREEQQQQQQ